jgi:hypothetical protein
MRGRRPERGEGCRGIVRQDWVELAYDRGVPLDFSFFSRNIIPMFTRLQNLTFIKKCRKIIKKKERKMLFGNISDFCLKITFEKA